MSATDVAPSRLAAAQQAAGAFVDAQPDTVDIGVVGFDQGALTTSLPDADRTVSKAAVDNLRTLRRDLAGRGDPRVAERDHRQDGHDRRGRRRARPGLLGLGDDRAVLRRRGRRRQDDAAATAAATAAQNAGVHIETVGVGTATGTTVKVDGYSAAHRTRRGHADRASRRRPGAAYHPASDAAELDGIASSIDLRLTVAKQDVPAGRRPSSPWRSRCSSPARCSPRDPYGKARLMLDAEVGADVLHLAVGAAVAAGGPDRARDWSGCSGGVGGGRRCG